MSENSNLEETKRLLLKAEMDLDDAAEFEKLHKSAFRIAFDFMNACFPPRPGSDEEYWKRTAELYAHRREDNKHNPLVDHLCLGVIDYLGEIAKDLPFEDNTEENDGNPND